MPKETILIVEDEEDILELIRYNLSKEGYQAIGAKSGKEALEKAKSKSPDVVILDIMLPDIDGLEVCKILKQNAKTAHIPIIMLTAKTEDTDIVSGLELGADDYITKPFSPKVLIARLRAVIRRRIKEPVNKLATVKIHDIEINPARHEIVIKGKQVDLTLTEFLILHFLAQRPGLVFTRYQIVDAIKGEDYPVTERSVDVHIAVLRKKLGKYGEYIETVRGIGYKLKDEQ